MLAASSSASPASALHGDLAPRLLVLGVGGAGGNAVDNMIASKLDGVEFVAANTDAQALSRSRAGVKLQLGAGTTRGLGAGARPELGAAAAEDALDDIRQILTGAQMVFITAGLGGGTGTGAAPVIARVARELGVLTVAVVTKPFAYEGVRRMTTAEEGLQALSAEVDTMIVVPNQNLFRLADEHTTFAEAFALADDVLHAAVRGVADLITRPSYVNLDFADVRAVLEDAGPAMMGVDEARGPDRAREAARSAVTNPLLDDISLSGARSVLINITGSPDLTLYEMDQAANEIRAEADPNAHIIVGSAFDEEMGDKIRVAVLATGMDVQHATNVKPFARPQLVTETDTPSPSAGAEQDQDATAREAARGAGAGHEARDDDDMNASQSTQFGRRRRFDWSALGRWISGAGAGGVAGGVAGAGAEGGVAAAAAAAAAQDERARPADRTQTGPNPSQAHDGAAPNPCDEDLEPLDEDELEIPAFLRRQAG